MHSLKSLNERKAKDHFTIKKLSLFSTYINKTIKKDKISLNILPSIIFSRMKLPDKKKGLMS